MGRIHHRRRLRILARDKFICQNCKCSRAKEVHHKISSRRGGSDKGSNLISLCHSCHMVYRRII